MTGHEEALMNEYLQMYVLFQAYNGISLTAPTNDEVMILLLRQAAIKQESLIRRSLC